MDTSAAAPGWYADPWQHAELRFWDGQTWTTSIAGHNAQSAVMPVEAQAAASSARPSNREKGAGLEQRVAEYLRTVGYSVSTNVVLSGRSGATHEIDVLAERADALTTFRVAVECKAWEQPIEKDVVAKFEYSMRDLGIREGVIASLSGFRSGAVTAADELHIALWGPEELATRLGQVSLAALSTRAPTHVAKGMPFRCSIDEARLTVQRQAKGRLGLGGETVAWLSPVWVPAAVVQIASSHEEGRIKRVTQTQRLWNAYELITGSLVARFSGVPALCDVDLARCAMRPMEKESAPGRAISEAVGKYRSVSTEQAKARHAERLRALGVPPPYNAVPETTELAYLPLYAAVLQRGNGERIVAVDGGTSEYLRSLSALLSRHIHLLRQTF